MSEDNSTPVRDAANEYATLLREKILFGLSIYKFVSPTQLHVFLGTSTPSALWKDQVLSELIAEGSVISENVTLTSPFDRSQSYTVLHLPENVYTPPIDTANPSPSCATPDSADSEIQPVA